MPGMGTLINMFGIVLGGLVGLFGKRFMKERYQETLMRANGVCVMFIGLGGALQNMLVVQNGKLGSQGTMMLVGSFAIGALAGEALNIEAGIERFGEWLKRKSGSEKDASFLNAFLTASFTVSIGAMAIVGALQDGMQHDISTLVTKAILDFMIIMVMTASLGKGCMFAAIPVGVLQGSVTILAQFIAPFMTEVSLNNLSLTGSVLIFCVGVNLIWPGKFRVANMIPAVLVAMLFGMW